MLIRIVLVKLNEITSRRIGEIVKVNESLQGILFIYVQCYKLCVANTGKNVAFKCIDIELPLHIVRLR